MICLQREARPARKTNTLSDVCAICKQKVYVMERHMDGSRLFHRRCIREQQRSLPRRLTNEKKSLANNSQINDKIAASLSKQTVTSWPEQRVGHQAAPAQAVSVQAVPVQAAPVQATPVQATTSSLFTKLNAAPAAYSSPAISTSTTPLGSNSEKSTVPTNVSYTSLDLGLSSKDKPKSTLKNSKFQSRFYCKENENPLLQPVRSKAADTRASNVFSQSPDHSRPAHLSPTAPHTPPSHFAADHSSHGAYHNSTAQEGASGVESECSADAAGGKQHNKQVLHGLLFNLAALRHDKQSAKSSQLTAIDCSNSEFLESLCLFC